MDFEHNGPRRKWNKKSAIRMGENVKNLPKISCTLLTLFLSVLLLNNRNVTEIVVAMWITKPTPNFNNLLRKLQQSLVGAITWANAFIIVIHAFVELIKTYVYHVDKINQAADAERCLNNW